MKDRSKRRWMGDMGNASFLLIILLAPLGAQPDRFGLSACSGPDRELVPKHAFTVCHSAGFKAPLRAIHEVSPSPLVSPARRMHFRRDWSLSMPGASDSDYRNSGFSRGHLVPARDVAGDEQALSDSFLLSNAIPQNDVMNRSSWRRIENWVRKLAEQSDSVIVVTGVIFAESPERIAAGVVAVPSALYKIVLIGGRARNRLIAVKAPNTETGDRPLDSFIVTVAEIERVTGLKFFPDLDVSR